MRTQDEIVAEIELIRKEDLDLLGFKTTDLLGFLDFEHAKPYLKPETTTDKWEPLANTRQNILGIMKNYMAFAWDKANNCQEISAARSMAHYSVWVWMLGDEKVFGDLEQYNYYGKDNLTKLCEYYSWDSKQWDDNIRVDSKTAKHNYINENRKIEL